MYEDGEQFKPDCSRLCTCQNGQYGCISLCPQEEKRPSLTSCSNPRLMIINGRCCREWTCDTGKQQNDYAPPYDFAQNLVLQCEYINFLTYLFIYLFEKKKQQHGNKIEVHLDIRKDLIYIAPARFKMRFVKETFKTRTVISSFV